MFPYFAPHFHLQQRCFLENNHNDDRHPCCTAPISSSFFSNFAVTVLDGVLFVLYSPRHFLSIINYVCAFQLKFLCDKSWQEFKPDIAGILQEKTQAKKDMQHLQYKYTFCVPFVFQKWGLKQIDYIYLMNLIFCSFYNKVSDVLLTEFYFSLSSKNRTKTIYQKSTQARVP